MFVSRIFLLIDASFERSKAHAAKLKNSKSEVPQELNDEEDDDDNDEEEEELCRRNFEEMIGAVCEVATAHFAQQCLQETAQRITVWISAGHQVLALYMTCDLILHLKEHSTSIWPVVMPVVFQSMDGKDLDAATAAVYAVNVASPLASFAEAAPEAFRRLAKIVGGKKPKKTDHKGKLLYDNSVAALLQLARYKESCCPPDVQAWSLAISKLPITYDEDEAKKVHQTVVELLQSQHAGLLGSDRQNLGPILSALAEVSNNETLASQETRDAIVVVFKAIPRDLLLQLAGTFTEKQQKKIEKILSN